MRVSFIELRHLTFEYEAAERTVPALRDVTIAMAESEFLCVVGRSGCGKTTLLNIVAGFLQPTKGEVLIGGKPVTGRGFDRGVVFQDFAQLFPWRTAQRNVEFGLEMKGMASAERVETARRFLALVNLEAFAGAYPHELSGGMQQRVAIARALAYNPSVLLMDEPFAALDAQTREVLQEELLALMERPDERKTMVFITHSIDEAILLGDRIAVMTARPGRIREVLEIPFGRPRDVEAVRADPRFAELRAHIWRQLHTARPKPVVPASEVA